MRLLVRFPYCDAQVFGDEWAKHPPQRARTPDHVRIGGLCGVRTAAGRADQAALAVVRLLGVSLVRAEAGHAAPPSHVVCEACGDHDRSSHRLKIRTQ